MLFFSFWKMPKPGSRSTPLFIFFLHRYCSPIPVLSKSGPSCSKLAMSLVNVSLKFQVLILQIHCYFLLKKCENPLHCKGFLHFLFFVEKMWESFALQRILTFFQQKITVFVTLADICLTNLCLNDIVKLTTLWTTGPWSFKPLASSVAVETDL